MNLAELATTVAPGVPINTSSTAYQTVNQQLPPSSNNCNVWQTFLDPTTGNPYFWNVKTNETQWSLPTSAGDNSDDDLIVLPPPPCCTMVVREHDSTPQEGDIAFPNPQQKAKPPFSPMQTKASIQTPPFFLPKTSKPQNTKPNRTSLVAHGRPAEVDNATILEYETHLQRVAPNNKAIRQHPAQLDKTKPVALPQLSVQTPPLSNTSSLTYRDPTVEANPVATASALAATITVHCQQPPPQQQVTPDNKQQVPHKQSGNPPFMSTTQVMVTPQNMINEAVTVTNTAPIKTFVSSSSVTTSDKISDKEKMNSTTAQTRHHKALTDDYRAKNQTKKVATTKPASVPRQVKPSSSASASRYDAKDKTTKLNPEAIKPKKPSLSQPVMAKPSVTPKESGSSMIVERNATESAMKTKTKKTALLTRPKANQTLPTQQHTKQKQMHVPSPLLHALEKSTELVRKKPIPNAIVNQESILEVSCVKHMVPNPLTKNLPLSTVHVATAATPSVPKQLDPATLPVAPNRKQASKASQQQLRENKQPLKMPILQDPTAKPTISAKTTASDVVAPVAPAVCQGRMQTMESNPPQVQSKRNGRLPEQTIKENSSAVSPDNEVALTEQSFQELSLQDISHHKSVTTLTTKPARPTIDSIETNAAKPSGASMETNVSLTPEIVCDDGGTTKTSAKKLQSDSCVTTAEKPRISTASKVPGDIVNEPGIVAFALQKSCEQIKVGCRVSVLREALKRYFSAIVVEICKNKPKSHKVEYEIEVTSDTKNDDESCDGNYTLVQSEWIDLAATRFRLLPDAKESRAVIRDDHEAIVSEGNRQMSSESIGKFVYVTQGKTKHLATLLEIDNVNNKLVKWNVTGKKEWIDTKVKMELLDDVSRGRRAQAGVTREQTTRPCNMDLEVVTKPAIKNQNTSKAKFPLRISKPTESLEIPKRRLKTVTLQKKDGKLGLKLENRDGKVFIEEVKESGMAAGTDLKGKQAGDVTGVATTNNDLEELKLKHKSELDSILVRHAAEIKNHHKEESGEKQKQLDIVPGKRGLLPRQHGVLLEDHDTAKYNQEPSPKKARKTAGKDTGVNRKRNHETLPKSASELEEGTGMSSTTRLVTPKRSPKPVTKRYTKKSPKSAIKKHNKKKGVSQVLAKKTQTRAKALEKLVLTNKDCVFGRGRKKDDVRSGSLYRELVETHWLEYSQLSPLITKPRRHFIEKKIICPIVEAGGRFIMRGGEFHGELDLHDKARKCLIFKKIQRALFNERKRREESDALVTPRDSEEHDSFHLLENSDSGAAQDVVSGPAFEGYDYMEILRDGQEEAVLELGLSFGNDLFADVMMVSADFVQSKNEDTTKEVAETVASSEDFGKDVSADSLSVPTKKAALPKDNKKAGTGPTGTNRDPIAESLVVQSQSKGAALPNTEGGTIE